MTAPEPRVPRTCREVQSRLGGYAAGELGPLRRRAVALHLRRCRDCAAALELAARVRAAYPPAAEEPPPELLATLLAQARSPGLRARAAVPVRGAVSGARPVYSAVLLGGAAVAGTGVGWALWQGGRRAARALRGGRG